MRPFFSVIIPTYNQGIFLEKCLNSVTEQTFRDFEIIVIDNNSSDNTKGIIKKFKKRIIYKKIRNQGVIAKSRNYGIRISKGKWISFLDSDDKWEKNKLKITYAKIKKNDFDVICNSEWILKDKVTKIWIYGPYRKNFYERMIKYGNHLSTSASTVKSDFIKKNNIYFRENKTFTTSEDYDFFLNIANKSGKFFFVSKPLGYHYFHDKSLSFKNSKHEKAIYAVLKNHIFKIQSFSNDKKKLWSLTKSNIELKNNIVKITRFKPEFKKIFKLIMSIVKRPAISFNLILIILLRKIKETILYYFY